MSENESFSLAIVSPVYKAEGIVGELVEQTTTALENLPYDCNWKIILVNDGSPDESWSEIKRNCQNNLRVVGVNLSKNFGQHAAIEAGVEHFEADYTVVLDCDLQENPADIIRMLDKALKGNDIVLTRRRQRSHSLLKNFYSWCVKVVWGVLIPDENNLIYDRYVGTMTLFSAKARRAYLKLEDYHKPFLAVICSLGFKTDCVEVEHKERFAGESSYSVMKGILLALNGIISFSERPLYFSIYTGLCFMFLSFCYGFYIIFRFLVDGIGASGWPSLIVAVVFSSGMIMFNMGILSLYIAKIFLQVKRRPRFIIDTIL